MQDVQNIPIPDSETNDADEEFGSHSDLQPESPKDKDKDFENPNSDEDPGKSVSLPTDRDPFPKTEGVPTDTERTSIE